MNNLRELKKELKKFARYKFKKYPRLQISVHKFDGREKIIPIDRKYPIKKVLKIALRYSIEHSFPLTLNWVLLKGVNDSKKDAKRLGDLFDPKDCRINITDYVGNKFDNVPEKEKEKFIGWIKKASKKNILMR